ncbi:hypothetical protein JCM5353_006572 [Sporobolomyces roseus]
MSSNDPQLLVPAFTHPQSNDSISRSSTPSISRNISLTPKPHRPLSAPRSKVFVGVAISNEEKGGRIESVVVISDGTSVMRSERSIGKKGQDWQDVLDEITTKVEEYARTRGHKIEIIALSPTLSSMSPLPSFAVTSIDKYIDRTWLSLDALPFIASLESAKYKFSLASQAVAAVEEAVGCLEVLDSSTMRIEFDQKRQVLVDANHRVHLHSLTLLKQTTSPSLFSTFELFSSTLISQKTRIGFFSATPRGGGVALMRHALIRLWHQVGVDAKWFVPPGDSAVFDVTKRKFHNVLQGVASTSTILAEKDKQLFENWTEWYYKMLWEGNENREDMLKEFDVIVIDDPQLSALIPIIRKVSPRTKIIYRSHIQIRSDLIDRGVEQQTRTWDYLWSFIRLADLFVAHPVEEFVPQVVKDSMPIVYMPPCTSPFDGLNKPIPTEHLDSYRRTFNLAASSAMGKEIDWERGYILQIARFDPSKGIPHLVEAYRLFRFAYSKDIRLNSRSPPQLVLTGHSSIDDPDSVVVLKALHAQLDDPSFNGIRDDIFSVRAPSSDRLLNTILRGADVVCQVSTREGYEIKVSEAIHQGKWVIGTNAGGIPLQIEDGVNGTLVEVDDPKAISTALHDFYVSKTDIQAREDQEIGKNEIESLLKGDTSYGNSCKDSERHFTLGNSTMWEFLFLRLLGIDSHLSTTQTERLEKLGIKEEDAKGVEDLNGKRVWGYINE